MKRQKNKSQFRRGFKKWADDKSIELRKEMGLRDIDPLCAFELSKHLGIQILEPNNIDGLSKEEISHLLTQGNTHWSAATVPISKELNIIIHNPVHSPTRQQSNIMHELAHILCDHKVESDSIISTLSGFLRNHNDEQEKEAEWLGGCLQLPKPALLWALKKGMSTSSIANYFNASEQMARYRLNISGAKIQIKRLKKYWN